MDCTACLSAVVTCAPASAPPYYSAFMAERAGIEILAIGYHNADPLELKAIAGTEDGWRKVDARELEGFARGIAASGCPVHIPADVTSPSPSTPAPSSPSPSPFPLTSPAAPPLSPTSTQSPAPSTSPAMSQSPSSPAASECAEAPDAEQSEEDQEADGESAADGSASGDCDAMSDSQSEPGPSPLTDLLPSEPSPSVGMSLDWSDVCVPPVDTVEGNWDIRHSQKKPGTCAYGKAYASSNGVLLHRAHRAWHCAAPRDVLFWCCCQFPTFRLESPFLWPLLSMCSSLR